MREGASDFVPAFGPLSLVTTSLLRPRSGHAHAGRPGATSGGNDSYTFIQANWNSQSLAATTATDNVTDTGSDSYSLAMTGTRRWAPAAASLAVPTRFPGGKTRPTCSPWSRTAVAPPACTPSTS